MSATIPCRESQCVPPCHVWHCCCDGVDVLIFFRCVADRWLIPWRCRIVPTGADSLKAVGAKVPWVTLASDEYIVVRSEPLAGAMTKAVVHRTCLPWQARPENPSPHLHSPVFSLQTPCPLHSSSTKNVHMYIFFVSQKQEYLKKKKKTEQQLAEKEHPLKRMLT